jgi:hypothetical protein
VKVLPNGDKFMNSKFMNLGKIGMNSSSRELGSKNEKEKLAI